MAYVTYDATIGSLTLKQVFSSGLEPNVTTQAERAAGSATISQLSVIGAEPQSSFMTGDIAGVIGGVTSLNAGLYVSSGSIVIPFNQRSNGGLFTSGSTHFTLSGANGLLLPQSFSASHGEQNGAACRLQLFWLSSDGETAPVAANVNHSLSSSAFNLTHEFGPVSVNGTQLTKAVASEVMPGVPAHFESYDGDHYPQYVHIDAENIEPMIRITFANMAALNTYGALWGSITAATAHYRRRADGGTTVSDASNAHVRFSFGDGLSEEYLPIPNGPDGLGGLLVGWRPGDPSQKLGFFPDEQTWIVSDDQKYFIGFWNADPPTPTQLQRGELHDGYFVKLQDGHEWVVPAAALLPKDVLLVGFSGKSQTAETRVKAEHFDFWEESKQWVRDFLILEGTAPETLKFNPLWAPYVYRALCLNYRLTPEVPNHLRLLDEANVMQCLRATISGLLLDDVTSEKKNGESAPTPDT
eukprot:g26686.t1